MIFRSGRKPRKGAIGLLKIPGILIAFCAFISNVHAMPINAITVAGGIPTNPFNDTVVGWTFTAEQNIDVVSLGAWDFGADGFLGGSTEVGLWDITGSTLLASTFVLSGDPISSDGFRFGTIGAISLTAGTDYVIASLAGTDLQYLRNATVTNSPGVSWGESRAVESSTLIFPTGFLVNQQGYFGANLQYVQSVPEPGTLALFGFGLIGLGWSIRRKV